MAEDITQSTNRDAGALDGIRAVLRGLQFGSVTAVVEDGIVVQIFVAPRKVGVFVHDESI